MNTNLKIVKLGVDELTPYKNNAKTHPREQIEQIKASIEENGFCDPIAVWGADNIIVEGHGRLIACKELGIEKVECIRLDHLTDEQRRAYTLTHNKLTMNSGFDDELLSLELEELQELEVDVIGFEFDEFSEETETKEIIEDEAPEVDDKSPAITQLGDIWQLGRHRLMCGDSTDVLNVDLLMNGEKADLGFCDPPYNLGYEYNEYDDNKTDEEYKTFSKEWYRNLKEVTSRRIVTLGTKNIGIMANLDEITGVACWVKKNWVTSCKIAKLQQWEPIFFYGDFKDFKRTSDLFEINREYQKDVGENHTCPKQIKLIADIVENYSNEKEKIVDLFGGSGTTLIACEQLNRICYTMELDPKYCDVIVKRWETLTGEKAVRL